MDKKKIYSGVDEILSYQTSAGRNTNEGETENFDFRFITPNIRAVRGEFNGELTSPKVTVLLKNEEGATKGGAIRLNVGLQVLLADIRKGNNVPTDKWFGLTCAPDSFTDDNGKPINFEQHTVRAEPFFEKK